jgi:hypothetical protein
MSGYAWYRCSIQLPPGSPPSSLLLAPIVTSWVLYIDGSPVGGDGNLPTSTPSTSYSYRLFPLTTASSTATQTIHIAIRVFHSPMWSDYMGGGFYFPGTLAGDSTLLASELNHHQVSRNVRFVGYYTCTVISGIVGIAVLYLFLVRPVEREYLWFAVIVLAQCADWVLSIALQIWAFPPIPIYDFLDGFLQAVAFGATFLFISRILSAPIGKWGRFQLILLAISPFCAILYWPQWTTPAISAATQLILQLPAILWPIYLLVRHALRRNQDARLLLIPTLLATGYFAFDNLSIVLFQAGLLQRPAFMDQPLPLPPFTLRIQTILDLVFLLAMLIFLIRRFSLARRREERLAAEFEAARQVQQVLLPDQLEPCPGFRVEAVYEPAESLGGDFFQQIADSRGGMTIVVGDVSGKGLPAAMIVSVLVGAIRTEAAHGAGPLQMLQSLNQRMIGRAHGGFVTCLAAHISASGRLTLANAGHLPPYRNGEELPLPGSVPLGIIDQPDYESITLNLDYDDRLVFLSDGVVEAQSRSGELFGFDRTRQISHLPAAEIAHRAQLHGQQDDITVLTIEFTGVPAA